MRAFLFVILFGVFGTAWGAGKDPWRENTRFLPTYCKDRVDGIADPKWNKWRRVFGDMHITMHHYCDAIFSQVKAKTEMDPGRRRHYVGHVANQMREHSTMCQVGCVLYPDVHTRWGWALAEQGKVAEAIRHYRLSIEAKPDYVRAYAGLSDLYVDIDQPEEAAKVLEEGLQSVPKSKMLKRKLEKISESQ